MIRLKSILLLICIIIMVLIPGDRVSGQHLNPSAWNLIYPLSHDVVRIAKHPQIPNILLAGVAALDPPRGIYRSETTGANWGQQGGNWSIMDVAFDKCALDNPKAYVVYSNIIQWSTDKGITWPNSKVLGLFDEMKTVLACNNLIIVGVAWGAYDKIKISRNWGIDWEEKFSQAYFGQFNRMDFDPNNSNMFFAGHSGYGMFRSNGGDVWEQINSGLPSCPSCLQIRDIAFTNGAVWIAVNSGATHGIFKSTDSGSNWTPVYTSFQNTDVSAISFDDNGSIYIGTHQTGGTYQGVYRCLLDSPGPGCVQINTGFGAPLPSINNLLSVDMKLFAGTNSGIWFYEIPPLLFLYTPMILR